MPWNNDSLLIGGFGQPAQNTDATGRRLRSNATPLPQRKPIQTRQKRKEALLKDKGKNFNIALNSDADGSKPWYAIDSHSEVKPNEKIIEREAKKAGVNQDMVKAIVYLETTQGYYDGFLQKFSIKNNWL